MLKLDAVRGSGTEQSRPLLSSTGFCDSEAPWHILRARRPAATDRLCSPDETSSGEGVNRRRVMSNEDRPRLVTAPAAGFPTHHMQAEGILVAAHLCESEVFVHAGDELHNVGCS